MNEAMQSLADRLGWTVRDDSLVVRAMSHRSWCAESRTDSNERLEFLGDSVMQLAVTEHLFNDYQLAEGQMAQVRAAVVNTITLAEIAAELGVGAAILLGRGESASGGREKVKILADAMEAIFGAIYLDRGPELAATIILRLLGDRIRAEATGPGAGDFKTRLQELCARKRQEAPRYVVTESGPDHGRMFTATVYVGTINRGTGSARSKKQAEHGAAQMACQSI